MAGNPMLQLLLGVWTSNDTIQEDLKKVERPTQKKKFQALGEKTWEHWMFLNVFCNDKNDGGHPWSEFKAEVPKIRAYAKANKCTLEDACTALDPNPN